MVYLDEKKGATIIKKLIKELAIALQTVPEDGSPQYARDQTYTRIHKMVQASLGEFQREKKIKITTHRQPESQHYKHLTKRQKRFKKKTNKQKPEKTKQKNQAGLLLGDLCFFQVTEKFNT